MLALAMRDALRRRHNVVDATRHLEAAMRWLCRAHDAAGRGGVSRSYSLRWMRSHRRRGWLGAYPETTGYIISTFFEYAQFGGDPEFRERALQMARWEIDVQMGSGAVQAATVDFPPRPAVFNTGQVLFGWTRAYRETGDERFLAAARRAADFLVQAQDPDGVWRRHGSRAARPGINLYDARSAWGMIETAEITGDSRHRASGTANLDHVVQVQYPNGWFPNCCLDDDERPLLHTIAYTMEGLLGGGLLLENESYIEACRQPADVLLGLQRRDGSLAGRFGSDWRPIANWSCLTGDAQTAIVWLRLFRLTGERKYLEAGRRMNRFLASTQDLEATDPGIRGGIKGSLPIWQEYGTFEYLNWASKFFADALLLEAAEARPS